MRTRYRNIVGIIAVLGATAAAALNTAKEFYCRDPDTGKLYPVNAAWPSSTFCGTYTCTLRKKNVTTTENEDINTENNLKKTNNKENRIEIKEEIKSNPMYLGHTTASKGESHTKSNGEFKSRLVTKLIPVGKKNVTRQDVKALLRRSQDKDTLKDSDLSKKNVTKTDNNKNDDRYLSDAEIKTLSTILKSMKKSDLEAILDVYNIAQDIYKEIDIDPGTEDNKTSDTTEKTKDNDSNSESSNMHLSYWYEPLVTQSDNHRIVQDSSVRDMIYEGSEANPHIVIDLHPHSHIASASKLQHHRSQHHHNLVKISGTNSEYVRLPYYYPITDFNRVASYSHPLSRLRFYPSQHLEETPAVPLALETRAAPVTPTVQTVQAVPASKLNHDEPCLKNHLPSWYTDFYDWYHKRPHRPHVHHLMQINVPTETKAGTVSPPLISSGQQLSMLYPLSYLQYNMSSSPLPLVENPWKLLNLNRQYNGPYAAGFVSLPAYAANVPHTILKPLDSKPNVQAENLGNQEPTLIQKLSDNRLPTLIENIRSAVKKPVERSLFPGWQTNDLPTLLNDVKANMLEKLSQHPIIKRAKLDRVGKVIKLDEISRPKRALDDKPNDQTENVEEYEVVLEKSTCETETEPGFFRVGKESEPYPACCPQRIVS